MQKKRSSTIIIAILIVGAMLIGSSYLMRLLMPMPKSYSYSEIIYFFEDQQVTTYEIDLGSGELAFKLKDDPDTVITYSLPAVSLFIEQIQPYVDEYNSEHPDSRIEYNWIRATDNSWLLSIVPYVISHWRYGAFVVFYAAPGRRRENEPVWKGQFKKSGASREKRPPLPRCGLRRRKRRVERDCGLFEISQKV